MSSRSLSAPSPSQNDVMFSVSSSHTSSGSSHVLATFRQKNDCFSSTSWPLPRRRHFWQPSHCAQLHSASSSSSCSFSAIFSSRAATSSRRTAIRSLSRSSAFRALLSVSASSAMRAAALSCQSWAFSSWYSIRFCSSVSHPSSSSSSRSTLHSLIPPLSAMSFFARAVHVSDLYRLARIAVRVSIAPSQSGPVQLASQRFPRVFRLTVCETAAAARMTHARQPSVAASSVSTGRSSASSSSASSSWSVSGSSFESAVRARTSHLLEASSCSPSWANSGLVTTTASVSPSRVSASISAMRTL
mmetsp:Transcript_38927/g.91866  ORF Transcript_38927/g.91866 Transcript_38927/m.91866 type:complete len:302 (-) Transcript_38927:19-924(-)